MTLADDLKALARDIRAIPGQLGIRPYTVTVRVSSWSGGAIGEGTETVVLDTAIVEGGGQSPKVRRPNSEEVALGALDAGDLVVGPITPSPAGFTHTQLTGGTATTGQLVSYIVTGPDWDSGTARFRLKAIQTDRALHTTLTLAPVSPS